MAGLSNSTLRHFKDVDDLFDQGDARAPEKWNEQILAWVNELHERKLAQTQMGKRYRIKQQMLAKLAEQYLEKDEVERVKGRAAEIVEEGEEG